jgi:energy-converting hydrogenase A subunit R
MHQVQLNIDCDGPLALNDNAFELCRDFIKPHGDRLFRQVSRYADYLAEVAKKPGFQAGDTLKFILPFLKAHGVTNAQIEAHSQANLRLMPGAAAAFAFLGGCNIPLFAVSASYRQYAAAVGTQLGFEREHIWGTDLDLDRYELSPAEGEALRRLEAEVVDAGEIEFPPDAASLADLAEPVQEAVARLDRIFTEQLPSMEIGAILKEVNPVSGPEKATAVTDSLEKSGLSLADTIFVGGTSSDVAAFEAVRAGGGLAISFNGSRQAIAAAEVVLVSDTAWSIALMAAIWQSWGKEGILEIAAPETRAKSRSLVLPENQIEPIFSGLDGHLLNVYLSKGVDRAKLAKDSLAMRAQLRGTALAEM